MFLELDGTFWVQLINFAIFYAILRVVFLKPVGEAIRRRREYIDGVQHDFERFATEARAFRADAEAKRAAARREADERMARARSDADREAGRIVTEQGGRAAEIAAEARRTVDGEMTAARSREPELADALGRSLLERAMGALGG